MIDRYLKCLAAATLILCGGARAAPEAGVLRATLDNGLRVVIVRDPLAPVVTTELNYLVGSDEAPRGFPGTAHALEHMMFRGSPGLTKDQLAAIAANMGGSFNADTTESVTQFFFSTPASDLDLALHTEALRMRGLDASDAGWAKERGAIEQEVSRDLSSPDYRTYTEIRARLFGGTPYEQTPLGTRPSFDRTTGRMLRDFHARWYAPNNAILVIAGDVDPQAALARVRAHFGGIPKKSLPPRPRFDFEPVRAARIAMPTDSAYGSVYLAWRMPGLRSADYATALVLDRALSSQRAALFGMGMDGSALYGGFSYNPMPQAGVGMAVGIFARGSDPRPVLNRMRAILADAATTGVDPDLVEAAKRNAIAGLEFEKNSVSGLANGWSYALAFQGLASPQAIKQAIEAVTPAAVNALARKVFDPDRALTAILTPQSSAKPVASKGFGGAESFGSSPDQPVQLPPWAAQAFDKLAVPPSTLAPVDSVLPNGLRLIVQPESISDTVQVYGRVRTNQDLQAPAGEEGVADVLDGLFAFGSTSRDRMTLRRELDAISASAQAGSSFSLAVPAAHFEQGMALLADNELHPALPAPAFAIVQRQQAGLVAGQLESPDFLMQIGVGKALLPAGDPSLRYATPAQIDGLTLERVRAYYARAFRPDMTTIVVVGKVTPEQARRVVEQAFGGWKAGGPKPEVDYPAVPPNKPAHLQVPDASAVQASVQLAQTVAVTRDDPARFALNLGNQVLGGGFYASRLYRDLRDRTGLVYSVDSGFDLDKHRGSYNVSYGCDPKNALQARAIVVEDLKKMQTEKIADADMLRAKSILLRQIPLSEASFGAIGGQLLTFASEGRPLDALSIAARQYLALTAEDVRAAYARYIRPDDFVFAVKGPAPAP
ncbi:MAG: insulinase family protein [Burkholderiales bacterium]|nr:insulinase family protein [Burkholderiales bacterium]MDE2157925.1 insulinase family protein [Burkholderiales bacterium]MDE2505009.1 insulinase family protein [Burkholderiales bacterium]